MRKLHFNHIEEAERPYLEWAKRVANTDASGIPSWMHACIEIMQDVQQAVDKGFARRKDIEGATAVRLTQSRLLAKTQALIRELVKKEPGDPRSWIHTMTGESLHAFLTYFNQGNEKLHRAQMSQLTQVYAGINFNHWGRHVYEISEGLYEQLSHTELRGLRTDDLRLPYESLYLVLPDRADLKIWNDETGWHKIEGVYITEDPFTSETIYDEKGNRTGITVEEARNGPKIRAWRLLVIGLSKNPKDVFDDAMYHFTIRLPNGASLDDVLAKHHNFEMQELDPELAPMLKLWRPIFQLVMNCMLYATWPDAEVDHTFLDPEAKSLWRRLEKAKGTKREKIKKRIKEVSQQKVAMLGRSIKVDRTRQLSEGGQKQSTGTLTVRVRVPGHWQHYWTGPKKSVRVRKFKAPYWKGEGVPFVGSRHILDKKAPSSNPDQIGSD